MPQVSERHDNDIGKPRFTRAYGFALITGLFFLLSWVRQFVAQVAQVRNEAQQQSKESGERVEAKLDRLLEERGIDPAAVTRQVNTSL